MAYIAPNSNIWICRGVPLDNSYQSSYRPTSRDAQQASILAYAAYTLTAQSYVRHSSSSIRVAISPDSAIGCNYMAFRNTSFGNKMFYAFITDIEYVNNETSLITYSIDVLQTYFFDVNIRPSYIEREHSITDAIGDSVTPEPTISSGQNVISKYQSFSDGLSSGLYTVIVTSHDLLNPVSEEFVFQVTSDGNLAGACLAGAYNVCNVTSATLQDFYNVMNNYIRNAGSDAILAMYAIPRYAYTAGNWNSNHPWLASNVSSVIPALYGATVQKPTVIDTINGYLPKNNKLYTYPYCFFRVQNSLGTDHEYRYEYFTGDSAMFRISTSGVTPDQCVYCTPENYRGFPLDWESSLIYDSYPATSFATSQYNNYIGNNSNKQLAGQLSRIASALTSAVGAIANPAQAVAALGGNFLSGAGDFAAIKDMESTTATMGGVASGYFNLLYDQNFFKSYRVTVNASVAKQYDDYFTMYGYAVDALKTPNFIGSRRRSAYNYCKTKSANITSGTSATNSVPTQALNDFKNALNSGICWWEVLSNTGNYNIPNNLP